MRTFWLDLAHRGEIRDAHLLGATGLMRASGINLGNLVFRRALEKITPLDAVDVVDYGGFRRLGESGAPDRVIVSAANWLASGEAAERDNAFRRRLLESASCPVVVFGLGAQAGLGGRPKLGPETTSLARLFAERAASISVRDRLTASVLGDLGIHNTVVTGCPSNFLNPAPDLGARIAARISSSPVTHGGTPRLHITEYSGGHSDAVEVLARLLRLLRNYPANYVLQGPELLPYALRESDQLPPIYARASASAADGSEPVAAVVRRTAMHFSGVDAWLDFARTCDLSIGMRIHGTMVALQAGVPALLIAHDSRTSGLAEQMHVPRVSPAEFLTRSDDLPWIVERVSQGLVGYDRQRKTLAGLMRRHLVDNGLESTAGLNALCDS